jgi:hypothetical protein
MAGTCFGLVGGLASDAAAENTVVGLIVFDKETKQLQAQILDLEILSRFVP